MPSPNSPIADRVLERMAPVRLGPPRWLRVLLAVAASAQVIVAIPWLVGADPAGLLGQADASHMTRDGAFGMAIGLAGLVTVWQHRYAIAAGVLSVSILLVQFGTGLIDGHADRVTMWVEVSHLPMTLITALILLAARPEQALGVRRSGGPEPDPVNRSEGLRLVAPAEDD
jgi:hypothetical protein